MPKISITLDGQIGEAFELVRRCCSDLQSSESPLRLALEQKLMAHTATDRTSIQLLVPRKLVSIVDNAFDSFRDFGLKIEVLDTTRAKRSDIGDTMYVFGAPEDHAGPFKKGNERSREVAWVFNSPSARELIQFQFADSPPFDVSKYEVWPGTQQLKPKIVGSRPYIEIPQFEQQIHIEEVHQPNFTESDPVVDASLVHLLDGRYVYYSELVPPRPICIRSGEASVEIDDDVKVSALRPGDVLLIRTGSASHSYLRQHAIAWLQTQFEQSDIDSFFEIIDTYKTALKSKYGSSLFLGEAKRQGLDEHYVRRQILRAFNNTTIATQSKQNFIALSNALGLAFGDHEWSAVSRIQTAHRQAGSAAMDELRESVKNDDTWLGTVNEPGIAVLNSGSAGEIVLIPVVSEVVVKHRVSVNDLGQLKLNRRILNG
jgi:hypothetical protein